MNPPTMAGWNLALRFGLEVVALTGIAVAAWELTAGPTRWVAVSLTPLFAAAIWGTFNVLDDPSRSGKAPIEVSGITRLVIELLILGGGAVAIALVGGRDISIAFISLMTGHYMFSTSRLRWLLNSSRH